MQPNLSTGNVNHRKEDKKSSLTVEGYKGTMNSLFVAVAKIPIAFFALTAELAAAGFWEAPADEAEELELLEFFLLARLPRTPPRTAATMTITATGIPNLTQLLVRFFGLTSPVSEWSAMEERRNKKNVQALETRQVYT